MVVQDGGGTKTKTKRNETKPNQTKRNETVASAFGLGGAFGLGDATVASAFGLGGAFGLGDAVPGGLKVF